MSATCYCDRRGVAGLVLGGPNRVPDGTMPVFTAATVALARETMGVVLRHAYDGKTLLVPGIPEADGDEDAYAALNRFRGWVSRREGISA